MANESVVGRLRILLSMDSAEFQKATQTASKQARAFEKSMLSAGRQLTNVGAAMTKTLTVPILGLGAASVKAAMDFESSFAGVRKTVQATEAEFAQMAQGFRDLAKTIPVNVNELNRLGEAAGALGIPKAEIVDFARVMALLGVTTNVTSDQAAESIAKIQNIFNAAGKETENFASALVALGNDGASTETQILDMATRIAGAGNAINMTQGEVLAFASALSSVGIEAEMGGSAISRVFIDIASAVSNGGSELANFAKVANMSATEFSKLFKEDAASAVNAFINGLGRVKASGGDLLATLQALGFSEIRVRDTLLRTAGAGDLLTRALDLQKVAWRDNSALSVEAGKRFETTSSQIALLWNRVKDVGITLGNALLPAIRSTVSLLNMAVPILEKVAQAFGSLPGPVQMIGVGLLGLVAAAGPAVYILGQLALSAAAVAKLFTAKGIAAQALQGNVVGLTGAIGLLSRAVSVVGVAFASWTVTRLIIELAGLDAAIEDVLFSHGKLAVQLQTDAAKQDSINLAIKRGADATISYAEAIQFNDEWLRKRTASLKAAADEEQRTAGATAALTDKLDELSAKLASANAEIADLSAEARQKLTTAIKSGAFSMEELEKATGLSSEALKLFKARMEAGAKATEAAVDVTEAFNRAVFDAQVEQDRAAAATMRVNAATKQGSIDMWEFGQVIMTAGDSAKWLRENFERLYTSIPTAAQLSKNLKGLGQIDRVDPMKAPGMLSQIGGNLMNGLGPAILGAFQGGGNVGRTIGGALGNNIGSSIGSGIAKAIGGKLGSMIGSVIPGIGTLLGGLAGGLISKIFGESEVERVDKMTTAFVNAAGGVDNLNAALTAATGNNDLTNRILNAQTVEEYNAAVRDAEEALQGLQRQLQEMGQFAGQVNEKLSGLRSLTPELEAALEGVYNAKTPQEYADAMARVNGEVDKALENQRRTDEAFARLGFTFAQLPKKIRDQKLGQEFLSIKNDIIQAEAAGADLNFTIGKAGPEMSELVQTAIKTGTEIPAALKPILMQAARLGVLTDEQGRKYTEAEIDAMAYGDTAKAEQDKVKSAMDKVVEALDKIIARLEALDGMEVKPKVSVQENYQRDDEGRAPGDENYETPEPSDEGVFVASGGMITARGVKRFGTQYFGHGGMVAPRSIFHPRGTDTVPAMLTPGEVVLNNSQQDLLQRAFDAMRMSKRQVPIIVENRIHIDGQEMKRWQRMALQQDTENNVSGFRTGMREALGID